MASREDNVNTLNDVLDWLNSKLSRVDESSISSHAIQTNELYRRILNHLFGWNLKDACRPRHNPKIIDLVDENRRSLVKIMCTCNSQKVSRVLQKKEMRSYANEDYRIKFVFVGEQDHAIKQRRRLWDPYGIMDNQNEDCLLSNDLAKHFEGLDTSAQDAILRILDEELTMLRASASLMEQTNDRLKQQRSSHPSFVLLYGKSTDASAEDTANFVIPNTSRTVTSSDGIPMSFSDFVFSSWHTGRQNHLLITGTTGVGRTIAMLTMATEEAFSSRGVVTIYVPLRGLAHYAQAGWDCVDLYLEATFTDEQTIKAIQELADMPWLQGPALMLLIDGYDKIPANKRQAVNEGLQKWATRSGVQIVTTSWEIGTLGIRDVKRIELCQLTAEQAKTYLQQLDISIPNGDNKVRHTICVPLMLRLYASVSLFIKREGISSDVFESSDSGGHLVWNYLVRILHRYCQLSDVTIVSSYVTITLLIIPYICWRMAIEDRSYLSENELIDIAHKAFYYWKEVGYPRYLKNTNTSLLAFLNRLHYLTIPSIDNIQQRLLHSDNSLLMASRLEDGDTIYSPLHPSFRDALAALHVKNAMDIGGGQLPGELNDPLPIAVKHYISDLTDDDLLKEIWESNRTTRPTSDIATHNLLSILHRKHDGNLAFLDWSGMDLSFVNLLGYRKDESLKLSHEASSFRDTTIGISCFVTQSHSGSVCSVSYSSDGSLFASASQDGTVRLWDAVTGLPVGPSFKGHRSGINSVCFSPDDKLLATGSNDGTIRLWDVGTGLPMKVPLEGHRDWIKSVCFSPDGRTLASGSLDETIRIWDIATCTCITILEGHQGGVNSVCYSSDGSKITSGSDDRTVRIWDVRTGKLVMPPLKGHMDWVNSVCFSADGKTIASCSDDGTVLRWSVETGDPVGQQIVGHNGGVRSVCFSPDGDLVACGFSNGAVGIWNTEAIEPIKALFIEHLGAVNSVCFSPNNRLVVSGSDDGTSRVWDIVAVRSYIPITKGQFRSAFLDSIKSHSLGRHEKCVNSVCFSPDGMLLASGSDDRTLQLWNMTTRKQALAPAIKHERQVLSACFSSDGKFLASGSADGAVRLWHASLGWKIHKTLTGHKDWVRSICFSPDGTLLVSGSDDRTLRLWDVATGEQAGPPLSGHFGWVFSVCFSPNGTRVASGSKDGTLRLWDVASCRQIGELPTGHSGSVRSVCFSPDGNLLASGSLDGTLRLWDVTSSQQIGEPLTKQGGHVNSVGFSPDGTLLASGSDDGVLLWDVASRQQIGETLIKQGGHVNSVFFSPDGTLLASGSDNGTVLLWNIGFASETNTSTISHYIDFSGLNLSLADIPEKDACLLRKEGIDF